MIHEYLIVSTYIYILILILYEENFVDKAMLSHETMNIHFI